MDIDITITLIVPVYNVENYLVQCLESVVRQLVSFDEVVLINDGSTDHSQWICEKYVSQYDYFALINQENRGLSSARNVGLDHASGEYVLFLDSDDYLRVDTVKKLKDELKKIKYDAVYFEADIHCEKGYEAMENIYKRNLYDITGIQMTGDMFFKKSYPENYITSACLAVYKKEAIKNAGIYFPEGLYYEDTYFTLVFMIQAKCVVYLPEKLYQRRYRAGSITTSNYTERKFIDVIKIILLIWDEIAKRKNIALSQNKIYLKLISDYCGIGLERYRLCKKNEISLHQISHNIFLDMIRKYEVLVELYCLDDRMELDLLNSLIKNIKKIMMYCPECKMSMELLVEKIRNIISCFSAEGKLNQFYDKLLCNIPLNVDEYKVGVYGTGEHTEGLLAMYEKLIGKITCNLVFIDSYKENGYYQGSEIINYRRIDNSFDSIVISSFLYEREMIKNVQSVNKKVPIYSFYDFVNEDVFSGWDLWCRGILI